MIEELCKRAVLGLPQVWYAVPLAEITAEAMMTFWILIIESTLRPFFII